MSDCLSRTNADIFVDWDTSNFGEIASAWMLLVLFRAEMPTREGDLPPSLGFRRTPNLLGKS